MTVSRHEKAALAALREQLGLSAHPGPGNRPQAGPQPSALALLTGPGNPEGSYVLAMPLTTADIGIHRI